MKISPKTDACVGVNIPVQDSYPPIDVGGYPMTRIPGGWFLMGSIREKSNAYSGDPGCQKPHWVYVDSFYMGNLISPKDELSPENVFRVGVKKSFRYATTFEEAAKYLRDVSAHLEGNAVRLPTEAEYELGARGPAVNMKEFVLQTMETYSVDAVAECVGKPQSRYENFFGKVRGEIVPRDPQDSSYIRELIKDDQPFYGWEYFGTARNEEEWDLKDLLIPNKWGLREFGQVLQWAILSSVREINPGRPTNPLLKYPLPHPMIRGGSITFAQWPEGDAPTTVVAAAAWRKRETSSSAKAHFRAVMNAG